MISRRKIRDQMYFGVLLLSVIVIAISITSVQGAWKFRSLTKSLRERSLELPEVAELGQHVSELRSLLWKLYHSVPTHFHESPDQFINAHELSPDRFILRQKLQQVEVALDSYEFQLENSRVHDPWISESSKEQQFVDEFRIRLNRIHGLIEGETSTDWVFHQGKMFNPLETELSELQSLAAQIPVFMQQRMAAFTDRSRTEYKAWIWATVISSCGAAAMIALLIGRFRLRIIRPLEILVRGSREVAGGNFDHRIELDSQDEVAELADALNSMTENFQQIKADLNQQVQRRTKEVVRSEKMASVGFLAAGVAHEINNPLASIAWSAESLETRIFDILSPEYERDEAEAHREIEEMQKYLRRIQEEAFRVKEITGSLLDFARMGDVNKKPANLVEIIESVIDIVKPLSKYRGRHLVFNSDPAVVSVVNEQELKQVSLNLITNALASVEEGGTVTIELYEHNGQSQLTISDDGCGMDDEVLQHLFEPFFTRSRDGQGTGLGLSITYQIIEEHGGSIAAHSAGPGLGSTFTVTLPRVRNEQATAA